MRVRSNALNSNSVIPNLCDHNGLQLLKECEFCDIGVVVPKDNIYLLQSLVVNTRAGS